MGKITIELTIGGNSETIAFFESGSPVPPAQYKYYVGWASCTVAEFASMTGEQVLGKATKHTTPQSSGSFGQNNTFFLLYREEDPPRLLVLTSAGVAMPQDIVEDNTCPHDDVNDGEDTFKVFGMSFPTSGGTDTVTVNF